MQRFFVTADGAFIGSYDGSDEDMPDEFKGGISVPTSPEDARQRYINGAWQPLILFSPIEPTPFWHAALDLLQIKKSDVLNAIRNEDERYAAELEIEGRKTYQRDDPMVIKLAELKGYPPEQMDALWLYVQSHYK
jgi:hypothetical protein